MGALQYRKTRSNTQHEIEELFIKHLNQLEIRGYQKLQTILSELIANLKMHTRLKEGAIAGYINKPQQMLIFSIVNFDITIRENIKEKNRYIFNNDFDALMWALKKTHTTREEEEFGGLGLYWLTKYTSELNGDFIITSGNSYAEFSVTPYNNISNNKILNYRKYNLEEYFNGNIITIRIPYIIDKNIQRPNKINKPVHLW